MSCKMLVLRWLLHVTNLTCYIIGNYHSSCHSLVTPGANLLMTQYANSLTLVRSKSWTFWCIWKKFEIVPVCDFGQKDGILFFERTFWKVCENRYMSNLRSLLSCLLEGLEIINLANLPERMDWICNSFTTSTHK